MDKPESTYNWGTAVLTNGTASDEQETGPFDSTEQLDFSLDRALLYVGIVSQKATFNSCVHGILTMK